MTDILSIVKKHFLHNNGLTQHNLAHTLNDVMRANVRLADLYFESNYYESWLLEDSQIKRNQANVDTGFGLRTIIDTTAYLAYSNFLTPDALNKAASCVRQATDSVQREKKIIIDQPLSPPPCYSANNPVDSISDATKVKMLQMIDQFARQADPRICQVIATLASSYQMILIANTEGRLVGDLRPLIRLSIAVVAKMNHRTETGNSGGGARRNYDFFTQEKIEQYTHRAVKQALQGFDSKPAPSGTMPVVLGQGWPAVLLHESIGHGLEADSIRKKTSMFWNRFGEKIANDCCTIVDDATYPNARGSLTIDDEGEVGQYTPLIEKGVLKNFMQDKLNAALMNLPTTGNGRREGYNYLPIPRMTNTYLLPGIYEPDEIIATVKRGLYAVDFSGGQVDVTSGKFVFSAKEAYMIENGNLTQPIKNATLIGDGPSILHEVSMVGHDLALDSGIGVCGKEGQSVPVGVGQPTIKIDSITVGGTHRIE